MMLIAIALMSVVRLLACQRVPVKAHLTARTKVVQHSRALGEPISGEVKATKLNEQGNIIVDLFQHILAQVEGSERWQVAED